MNNRYNTFLERFAAGIVDGLVFLPLTLGYTFIQSHTNTAMHIIWLIICALARPLYTICMHGKYGQTLGKMATGVVLVNASETRTAKYEEAFWREVPVLIMLIFFIILQVYYTLTPANSVSTTFFALYNFLSYSQLIWFLIEIVTMMLNSRRRALHDYIANTVVIQKREFIPGKIAQEIFWRA
jgi:uncharacterized RDD family membrane protein YckC